MKVIIELNDFVKLESVNLSDDEVIITCYERSVVKIEDMQLALRKVTAK